MKTFAIRFARIAAATFAALAATACDPAGAATDVSAHDTQSDTLASDPEANPAEADTAEADTAGADTAATFEAHWSYSRAGVAFDMAALPTLAEAQGQWKTAAMAHSKSGNLVLEPHGIIPEGQSDYQELFTFDVAGGDCTETKGLSLTRHWLSASGVATDETFDLGASFLSEDAIPETLPLGPKGEGECRYLAATETAPEYLICGVRGISTGSWTYTCMVRLDTSNMEACRF